MPIDLSLELLEELRLQGGERFLVSLIDVDLGNVERRARFQREALVPLKGRGEVEPCGLCRQRFGAA